MRYCQCGCGQPLTGKQKLFASDACRMRYNRRKANSERSQMFANRSLFQDRQVTVSLAVKIVFAIGGSNGEMDRFLVNKAVRGQIREFLIKFLSEKYQNTEVLAVEIVRRED